MDLRDHESLQMLAKSRAAQLIREAEEWREALLAARSAPHQRGGLARALASWRAHLLRRRAESAALAEQEQS